MRALYVCKRVFTRIIYPLCDEQAQTGFLAGCSIDISAVEMANSLNIKSQRTIGERDGRHCAAGRGGSL